MPTVKIRNNTLNYSLVKDSFQRRMVQFENKIAEELKKIGVSSNYLGDFNSPKLAIVSKKAEISWGLGHSLCFLSVNKEKKYVDNLQLLYLCIKTDVDNVLNSVITRKEFEEKYAEDKDVSEKRKWAREHLGVSSDCENMEEINKAYKDLAKIHHPDVDGGNAETFKKVNEAHKILKRELE